jgi:hypothetical protein
MHVRTALAMSGVIEVHRLRDFICTDLQYSMPAHTCVTIPNNVVCVRSYIMPDLGSCGGRTFRSQPNLHGRIGLPWVEARFVPNLEHSKRGGLSVDGLGRFLSLSKNVR